MWKKGKGKLGLFEPLIGSWVAQADSPQGPVTCHRCFQRVLSNSYVQLEAKWVFADSVYQERAVFGVNAEKAIGFWSFTSDGKASQGLLADVTDVDACAIGFEATMPAGVARMVYWPDAALGFRWVVESKNKKGWRRFLEHHYVPG